tara:strand:+ start:948 stop:1217 length:270 start_codon:yes stop_codon:yes gene_type:complete
MNKIILILSFFFVILFYKSLVGDVSYFKYSKLNEQAINLKIENNSYLDKIELIKAEIENLQTGLSVIEEKARNELGLIKEKETFYQIIE